jgi:HD-GYP domain-containing protein (c-di-GMP phosphodiesterase class II)
MQESIPVNELRVGMHVTIPGSWFRHPFIRSRFVLNSQRDIEKIMNWGLTRVSVKPQEDDIIHHAISHDAVPEASWEPETAEAMPPDLMEALHESSIAPESRAAAVKACSKMAMKRLMENNPDEDMICEAKSGFYEVIDCILEEDHLNHYLLAIRDYDAYTYSHSVNVGVLSLLVARKYFGQSDRHDLRELGIGFFLHDLGKIRINPDVIMKESLLTDEEMMEMRRHPLYGFDILKETNQLTTESKLIVLEHHEREDGRGYPYGLYGSEIHEYARICALVDMYDALTSDRPYRQRMLPFQALSLIRSKLADQTQKALFETLVLVLGEN